MEKSNKREYGRAMLHKEKEDILFNDVQKITGWMSHADTILEMPADFELLATTESIPVAAFKKKRTETQPSLRCTVSSGSISF